jgi:hypothetical protein
VRSRYILPAIAPLTIRPSSVQRPSLFGAIPIALQYCFGGGRDVPAPRRLHRANAGAPA